MSEETSKPAEGGPIGIYRAWNGDPPKGKTTTHTKHGSIGKWELKVAPGKFAAQIFKHPGGKISYSLWFPTLDHAIDWTCKRVSDDLPRIETEMAKHDWGPASMPGQQKWIDLLPREYVAQDVSL